MVRAGLRALLESVPDFEVVAEASEGREAVRMVEQFRPRVALLDVMMPELNGLEALAQIRRDYPRVRVLLLSMKAGEEYVIQALRAGAAGYLIKNSDPKELEMAIRTAANDEIYLTPAVSGHVVQQCFKSPEEQASPRRPLTPRQREVLQLIAEGYTSKSIAAKMGISLKTVEMHRSQLMNALDIHDIAGLTRYAIRCGIISIEP